MKVHDIRSFFGKPGSSKSSSHDQEEQVVEVSSRLKKGSSKKSKKDERLNVSVSVTDEDSDKEDPLPKKMRKADDKSGKGKKKRKPMISDDSDVEDPLPKSVRVKEEKRSQDKKRKARVLSDSDDDDFKPSKGKSSNEKPEKPALKQAKVEKVEVKKKEELKPVNPADFFSSAPIKREKKVEPVKQIPSPEKKKKEEEGSPKKEGSSGKTKDTETKKGKHSPSSKTPPKTKTHNGNEESSPHRPPTSIIEPKKLKLETPTPEKRMKEEEKTKSSKANKTPPPSENKSKKTPEKDKDTFKVPTPVNTEKSKSRTKASTSKRSAPMEDDDEDDFDPKKVVKKGSTPAGKKGSSSKKTASKSKAKATGSEADTDEDKDKEKASASPAQKQNYMKYLAKMSMKPKNLGSKIIPTGAPDCLQGLTFVISGVLDSLEREDCKDLVQKYGGRVTTAVSRKTSYLIIGDDPGESKTNKANELKVPIINEDDLLEMLRKSNPNGAESQDSGLPFSEDMLGDSEQFKTENESDYDAEKSLFSSPARGKKASPVKKLGPSKLAEESSPKKKPKLEESTTIVKKEDKEDVKPTTTSTAIAAPADLMWVDKYRPKTLKNVVGQAGDSSNAKKLSRWLQNWFDYHGSSNDKAEAAWPGLKDPEGKTFKAALLSGPPGVGKTTTAHLAVKEIGYDYFELNASDTRNKRGLKENVADALSCKTLKFGRTDDERARKHVLIMDEVDGMSGNEDRGGVQELIALIKTSRIPLICICNDRNHPKIRSLANYCFDLRFNKPSFEQLRGFISSICFKEKIKIPQEKVQQLIISTDNDVRQILHQLELFKEGKSDQAFNPHKDLRFGPWDVIRKVFLKSEHDKMSIHDKTGLFFQDYQIGPLFVQENYLKFGPVKAGGNRYKHMDLLAKTAGSLGDGDLTENIIRRSQNWGLLPVQAVFSSYIPGEYMESNYMGGVEFPHWLGRNSNKSKRHRLLQSLHTHLHLHVSGSLEALNMDYLPYLRRAITDPLVASDPDSAACVMENYTLLRDDVESINDLSLWPGSKDPMEKVETKVKTAFTKKVNKEILPYSNIKPVKGRGKGGGGSQDDGLEALLEDGEGEGEVVEEEEEDESIEKDAMVKMKTRKGGSSKAKPTSSSSSGRGGSKKGKKAKDDYEDEEDDDDDYGKSSKTSKSKPPAKSRKK